MGSISYFIFFLLNIVGKCLIKTNETEKKTLVSFFPILIFSHCHVCLSDPWVFTLKKKT